MGVLLVTGSSRGIGAEICRQAARENWDVCVNYSSSRGEAEDVVESINKDGGKAIACQANVSVDSEVQAMFEKIDSELGTVSGLVNNAGVNGGGNRVEDIDPDEAREVFEINVLGTILCAKYAVKRMANRYGGSGGSIINVSSAASRHGGPGYTDYAASKGAMDSFTVGLAKEQAEEGVRVNCVRPGASMTELSVVYAQEHPEWLDWVMQQVPMGRPGEVDEIARAVLFLLSDRASYITGSILDASGGWVNP